MRHGKIDVLVVDDEPEVASCLTEALSGDQFACASTHSASEAFDLLGIQSFDVVLTDLVMPGMDGLELLDRIQKEYPSSAGILMSGRVTSGMARSALRGGVYDVIHKPFEIPHVRKVISDAVAAKEKELDRGRARGGGETSGVKDSQFDHRVELVNLLSATLAAKDRYTRGHSVRTAYYAEALGNELNLTARQLDILRNAALVHDIGKIGIPDAILTKPGPLTTEEFALMQQHPQMGYNILQHAGCLREELQAVLHHHEWWNGTGYPGGLKGTAIPLGARIIHIADAVDAMLSNRIYAKRNDSAKAVHELRLGLGTQFDPEIGRMAASWIEARPNQVLAPERAGAPEGPSLGIVAPVAQG